MKHFVQPTPVPVLDVSFNANLSAIPAALTALGFTYTCSTARYYFDGSMFQLSAINAFHTTYNPLTSQWEYYPEPSQAYTTKYSADFSNAAWVKSGVTRADATSCISGQVASKLTAAAAGDYITQIGSASINTTQTSQCFIEQGTAAKSKVIVYDGTNLVSIADAEITWATGVVTSSAGANFKLQLLGTGQNGGKLYNLSAVCTTATSGIIRSFRLFPDSSGGGGYCYLHYAVCNAGATGWSPYPIVLAGSNITRGAQTLTATAALASLIALKKLLGLSIVTDVFFTYHAAATRVVAEISDGTTTNRVVSRISPTNNNVVVATGSPTTTITTANMLSAIKYKVGVSARATSAIVAANGVLGGLSVNANSMPKLTQMHIGNSEASANQTYAGIERIRIYNYLTDQQLKRVTL